MALELHVAVTPWRNHLAATVAAHPGLVPVVKGNGYGFGRQRLVAEAAALAVDEIAVGTVHELAGLPVSPRRLVLTPALAREVDPALDAVLTVGSARHAEELAAAGWQGAVLVKLASSMRRYGLDPHALPALLDAARAAGLSVHGWSVHLPLAGTPEARAAEVSAWLPHLPGGAPVYVSHLDAATYGALRAGHPGRELRIRLGTALWLGDKSFTTLRADVLEVRPVRAGDRVGYRHAEVAADGTLVMVSAGTAHGVQALDDGRSPFHFARRRLDLVEPPHMHTSMVLVPAGDPCPAVGDQVDVQRPLTRTWVDRVVEV
jgi:alanine racemase